jgi:mono/diheme cytochrome c family protein
MWAESRPIALTLILLLAACVEAEVPPPVADAGRASEPGVTSQEAPLAASQATAQTVADLFPEGPERELVLANCASCHAVACAVIGQRTPGRWAALRESHRGHVADAETLEEIFTYLQTHFSEGQPEPRVPPELMLGGCTPF